MSDNKVTVSCNIIDNINITNNIFIYNIVAESLLYWYKLLKDKKSEVHFYLDNIFHASKDLFNCKYINNHFTLKYSRAKLDAFDKFSHYEIVKTINIFTSEDNLEALIGLFRMDKEEFKKQIYIKEVKLNNIKQKYIVKHDIDSYNYILNTVNNTLTQFKEVK